MSSKKNGALESAITLINMAELYERALDDSESAVGRCMDQAYECLKTPGIDHDGYYALSAVNAPPSFGHFGYFAAQRSPTRLRMRYMRGIELSRRYFEEYGVPMIKNTFSDIEDLLACGIVGEGSECLGCDDEISRDHDFCTGLYRVDLARDRRKARLSPHARL